MDAISNLIQRFEYITRIVGSMIREGIAIKVSDFLFLFFYFVVKAFSVKG